MGVGGFVGFVVLSFCNFFQNAIEANRYCGWEDRTEYHCTPIRTFLKFSTVVESSSDCGSS